MNPVAAPSSLTYANARHPSDLILLLDDALVAVKGPKSLSRQAYRTAATNDNLNCYL